MFILYNFLRGFFERNFLNFRLFTSEAIREINDIQLQSNKSMRYMKLIQVLIFDSAVICSVILHVHFYTVVQSGLGCSEARKGPKLTSIINGVNTTASPAQAEPTERNHCFLKQLDRSRMYMNGAQFRKKTMLDK